MLMRAMNLCRSFISVGSIGCFPVDHFLVSRVLVPLSHPPCRGEEPWGWEVSPRCSVTLGACESLRSVCKGFEKLTLDKQNKPKGRGWKRGRPWQEDIEPWLNSLITTYCCFANLIFQYENMKKTTPEYQEASFPLKVSSL